MSARTLNRKALVCAVHPTSRGFGWVIFSSPLAPVDWGIAHAAPSRNEKLLRRFERILERNEPVVLVLEEFEGSNVQRAERIQRLCRSMVHIAACRGMDTPVYSRAVVRTIFSSVGAATRYEIAEVIRQNVPAFSHRMPRKRKPWISDDPRQSLFDAAALALTHFGLKGDIDHAGVGSA